VLSRGVRNGGGVGGGGFFTCTTPSLLDLASSVLRSTIDRGGELSLSHAVVLAILDGNSCCFLTGLNVLGGVIGRSFGLAIGLLIGVVSCFTGSVSLLVFSNMDMRVVIGAIDVVSVRSRLVTELAALCPPTLLCRFDLGVGCCCVDG
jgi:hypothetical protein